MAGSSSLQINEPTTQLRIDSTLSLSAEEWAAVGIGATHVVVGMRRSSPTTVVRFCTLLTENCVGAVLDVLGGEHVRGRKICYAGHLTDFNCRHPCRTDG